MLVVVAKVYNCYYPHHDHDHDHDSDHPNQYHSHHPKMTQAISTTHRGNKEKKQGSTFYYLTTSDISIM